MNLLHSVIEGYGGIASRRELVVNGVYPGWIDLAAWYRREVIRVRNGWFARTTERRDVIRAWRVGGRLTCVSAIEYHAGLEPAAVVVHWTRHPGPGDRRSVAAEHAEAVVAGCGVHASGVTRAKPAPRR
jgi:hypothetical protein